MKSEQPRTIWDDERMSDKLDTRLRFTLVWFYGISTILGYLMPNPPDACILNIWFMNTFGWYIQLNDQTVLFLKIQFSISQ